MAPITIESALRQFPSFRHIPLLDSRDSGMRLLKLKQALLFWYHSKRKKKRSREAARIVRRRTRLKIKQRTVNSWTMAMLREVTRTRQDRETRIDKDLERLCSLETKLVELSKGEKELEERKCMLVDEHHSLKK